MWDKQCRPLTSPAQKTLPPDSLPSPHPLARWRGLGGPTEEGTTRGEMLRSDIRPEQPQGPCRQGACYYLSGSCASALVYPHRQKSFNPFQLQKQYNAKYLNNAKIIELAFPSLPPLLAVSSPEENQCKSPVCASQEQV